jgi:hypothetical protein
LMKRGVAVGLRQLTCEEPECQQAPWLSRAQGATNDQGAVSGVQPVVACLPPASPGCLAVWLLCVWSQGLLMSRLAMCVLAGGAKVCSCAALAVVASGGTSHWVLLTGPFTCALLCTFTPISTLLLIQHRPDAGALFKVCVASCLLQHQPTAVCKCVRSSGSIHS